MNKIRENIKTSGEIDLLDIFSTFFREKRLIFLVTFLTTLSSVIYFSFVKPIYQGSFNVVVKDNKGNNNIESVNNSFFKVIGGSSNSSTDLETQRLILQSPSVLMPVFDYVRDYYLTSGEEKKFGFKAWVTNSLKIDFEANSQVLNVIYMGEDKELINNALNLIASKYRDYSKKDTIKNLNERRLYLESQKEIMKKKSMISKKAYNKFTIENGLGSFDGFIRLAGDNISYNKSITNDNGGSLSFSNFNNKSAGKKAKPITGERFSRQFSLLERYEADYLDLSSKLKPNSQTLQSLKIKIDNLKTSLERPNEILIKYDELSRNYLRDENLLLFIDQNLEIVKLEQIKVPNPWEIISTPTISNKPIYPNRSNLFILFLIGSFILGSIIALIKEKISMKIFTKSEMKERIKCDFIDTIYREEKILSNKQLIKQFEGDLKNCGIINYTKKININFINDLLEEKNIKIIDFEDFELIDKCKKLILVMENGIYTYHELDIINKYISLYDEKIIGWFYINN